MDAWFLNHVLGLSLFVLLGLPGPLGAGTPGNNGTEPVTAGLHYSTGNDELGNTESSATSTSYSSESLSPSQRSLLLTHAAAETHTSPRTDTEQTHAFTETSSRSLETTGLSTEPLASTLVVATTEASGTSGGSSSITTGTSSTSGGSSSITTGSSTSGGSSSSTSGGSSSSSGGTSGTSSSSITSSSTSGGNNSSSITTGTSSTSGFSSSSSGGTSSTSGGSSSSSGGTSGTSSSSITSSSTSGGNNSSSITTGTSSTSGFSSSSSGGTSSTSGGSSSSSGGTSSTSGGSSSSSGGTSSTSGGSSSSSGGTSSITTGSNTSGGSSIRGTSSNTSGGSSIRGTSSNTSGGSSIRGTSSNTSGGSSIRGTSSNTSGGSSSTSGGTSGTSSSSTSGGSSSSGRDWRDLTSTEHTFTSSREEQDTRLPQNSPSTTLLLEDATPLSSQTAVLTGRTYTSTTISRAGERTLLSVTSSSTNITSSAFTQDSNSQQPSSPWDVPPGETETEHYTHSAPSNRTDSRETTNQQSTHSTKETSSEAGSPGASQATHSLTRLPNATQHQHSSTPEEPSDSTPPLTVTAPSTDQSEASASSTPPTTSPTGGAASVSESTRNLRTSTESSTASHSASTQHHDGTERLSSQTPEGSVSVGSSTASPSVSGSTSEMSSSTETPVSTYLTPAPVNVTDRSQMTEHTASTTATTTPSLPATSSPTLSSTSSSSPASPTEATVPDTAPPAPSPTAALQTSTAGWTPGAPPTQTLGPPTGTASPTDATSLQAETSTGALEVTTARGRYVSATYTRSPAARTTEAVHTTGTQTDRATTELLMTTSPSHLQTTRVPPVTTNPCASNPCVNGGVCVYNYTTNQFSCKCQQAWKGLTCHQDVDECEQEPCPAGSKCANTRGSFSCECPLGFDLEDGRTCTRAKTFLGTFRVSHDAADTHEIQRELAQLLNASLSALRGYRRSTLSKKENNGLHILAVNMFSISANVTSAEVYSSILMSLGNCSSSLAHCRKVLNSVALPVYLHNLTYQEESLCAAQETQCDKDRSSCVDSSGTAHCQCHAGYYKHNPDDLSCLECGDGYKLENGTCVPCMFGFGGFNCGNFYKLIAVVVAPTGGGLLLILIIALTVTCCKKSKNDINKIIFKSGDLQMSPYADFPKNNRISMEWGRETIEMQENGSTKNLLQMTDIYYSPALRNSDLDRNGLYPFMGLPGSRHSCIYPAQWNPSFISDDSRRRDYF